MDYKSFLESKRIKRTMFGFKPNFLPDYLKDFQGDLCEWSVQLGRAAILADCGLGKGHPLSTKILTPDGWTTVSELQIGSSIVGSDGTPCKVTGLFDRGEQETFEVFFDDGTSLVTDAGHLWAVRNPSDKARNRDWKILSTGELIGTRLKYGRTGQSRTWHIPMVQPVEFNKKEFVIHPYVLGVLLGDGGLKHTIQWTKPDEFIANKVSNLLPTGCFVRRKQRNCWSIVTEPKREQNPVLDAIRDMGLMVGSPEKFVPEEYLFSSYKQRLQLLRGLMDTDGYSGESPEFVSTSKKLAESVVFLAQSFGGTASITLKEDTPYSYKGEKKMGLPCYRVVLSMAGPNPFSLPRKKNIYKRPSRGIGRWIDRIENRGKQNTVCISVDSNDHLYVADHFIVTHNTLVSLVWCENILRHVGKRSKALIAAPLAVSHQFVREAEKFGMKIHRTQDGLIRNGINVTNYERLKNFRSSDFVAMCCDESGCIKNSDSKTRKSVTTFMENIPYRLLCTATPAPNDFMELGTSSEALGNMTRNQMLAMFFVNDGESTQQWSLKGHAKKRYWQWVSTWARAVRKPSDLGYDDKEFTLPPLKVQEHIISSTGIGDGFFPDLAKTLDDQRAENIRTLHERCELAASLVPKDRPCIVWCQLNPEGKLLSKLIPDSIEVAGCDKEEVKEQRLIAFAEGKERILVTKSKIAGFGLNLQHCSDVVYFPTYSAEQYYQAIRRCWRFGQKKPVNCHLVSTERNRLVLNSMLRKERQSDELFAGITREMNRVRQEKKEELTINMKVPNWI